MIPNVPEKSLNACPNFDTKEGRTSRIQDVLGLHEVSKDAYQGLVLMTEFHDKILDIKQMK